MSNVTVLPAPPGMFALRWFVDCGEVSVWEEPIVALRVRDGEVLHIGDSGRPVSGTHGADDDAGLITHLPGGGVWVESGLVRGFYDSRDAAMDEIYSELQREVDTRRKTYLAREKGEDLT